MIYLVAIFEWPVLINVAIEMLQLWFSDNFGVDWSLVNEFVKSYFLDTSTYPTTLYVEHERPGRDNIVMSSTSMFADLSDVQAVMSTWKISS